jgi:16S rRNA (uracil1498-N3)-methyltransferase
VRRFTIEPDRCDGDRVTFDETETRHLARVLRLRPGDTVIASDGGGREYTVRLEALGPTATGTVIAVAVTAAESPLRITLVQGIPKADKMDAIVRAATELGVARVWPVVSERTIVRLEAAGWRERRHRWQRVAKEATKQCGRAVVPDLAPPRPLADALRSLPSPHPDELRLCLWEGEAAPVGRALGARPGSTEALVLVGPEGGLSRAEVEAARAADFTAVTLGPRILRTETAGLAIVAILQFRLGDMTGP